MFLKGDFSNRLVQVSLFSALVYYITAYPVVFEKARKYFPIKFKKTHHLLIFHTFVFMVLMYLLTYFVFDPLVRVVEGGPGDDTLQNISNIIDNLNDRKSLTATLPDGANVELDIDPTDDDLCGDVTKLTQNPDLILPDGKKVSLLFKDASETNSICRKENIDKLDTIEDKYVVSNICNFCYKTELDLSEYGHNDRQVEQPDRQVEQTDGQ